MSKLGDPKGSQTPSALWTMLHGQQRSRAGRGGWTTQGRGCHRARHGRLEKACRGILCNKLYDLWYMDDGQIYCRPEDLDRILTLLDEELEKEA